MNDFELLNEGDSIIRAPELNYEPNQGGVGQEFFKKMRKFRHNTAQICAETGQRDTFSSLLKRCIRAAIEIKTRRITSKDIVAMCSYNHFNSCIPYIATMFVGARFAALDPTISFEDTKHLITQINPKMVFVVPESEYIYEDVLNDLSLKFEIVVFNTTGEYKSFSQFLKPSVEENDYLPATIANIFDTALIFFSSGTTGLAKGICINHYNILCQGANFFSSGFINNVTLSFASLYWISAAVMLSQSVLSGYARLLCKSYTPKQAWEYIDKYKVNLMFIAPSQAISMMKYGRPDLLDTTTLYDLIVGGGPLSAANMLAFRDLFPGTNVSLLYGQTEVAGVLTMFKPNIRKDVMLLQDKPSSSGRPIRGFWYKICDLDTEEELGPNCKGELRVKTKMQLNGYYNLPSDGIWDDEGWLKTGDICYYDEDHCFYVVDRIKELIKYQSWHVLPALLEGILQEHPAVQTAIVIGIPHEEDGEHPMGIVILTAEADGITETKLVDFVNNRVSERQKIRAGIKFVDSIPYTPTGKIKRKFLKDTILKQI